MCCELLPAALSVIVPYPAPCGVLLPLFLPQDAVNAPADLLGFFYLSFQREIPLQDRIYHIHVVYKCAFAGGRGRGASPLPLRRAPVSAPVCAAILRCMGGFGSSCNEKRSRRF